MNELVETICRNIKGNPKLCDHIPSAVVRAVVERVLDELHDATPYESVQALNRESGWQECATCEHIVLLEDMHEAEDGDVCCKACLEGK